MCKRKLSGIFLVFLFLASGRLHAEEISAWYIRVDGGISDALDPKLKIPSGPFPADLGNSALFGAGFGYAFVPGLRIDATFLYRPSFQQISGSSQTPQGKADFRSYTTLASGYLDLITIYRVSPYIGGGLGFAHNDLKEITIRSLDGSLLARIQGKSKTNLAWQLCAGMNVQLTNSFLIDAGYHFLNAGDYESQDRLVFVDGSTKSSMNRGSLRSHEFILSLQYAF